MIMTGNESFEWQKIRTISDEDWDVRELNKLLNDRGVNWVLEWMCEYAGDKEVEHPECDHYWRRIKNELTYMSRKLFGLFAPKG